MKSKNIFFLGLLLVAILPTTALSQAPIWRATTVSSTSQLPSGTIQSLVVVEDFDKGNFTLTLGTPRGAIMYDTSNSESPSIPMPDLEGKNIIKIVRDSHDLFWFCTEEHGLIKLDPMHGTTSYTTEGDKLIDMLVQDIVEDGLGGYFIANGNAVTHMQKGEKKFKSISPSPNPFSVIFSLHYLHDDKELLAGSEQGIFSIKEGKATKIVETEAFGEVLQILSQGNKVYAATQHGLAVRSANGWVLKTTEHGLPNNYITSLAISPNGELWAGTYEGNLIEFDTTGADLDVKKVYGGGDGIPTSPLRSLAIDKSEAVYVGTEGSGFVYRTNNRWHNVMPNGLLSDDVRSLLAVGDAETEEYWIGTSAGISHYQKLKDAPTGTWVSYTADTDELAGKVSRAITKDTQGNVWVAFFDGGVACYSADSKAWTSYSKEKGTFPSPYATDIMATSKGTLVATTYGGGFAVFENGSWQTMDKEHQQVPSNSLFSVAEGSDGKLWFSSVEGFFSYDGRTFEVFNSAFHKLPDDNVRHLAFGKNSKFYIGTNKGLLVVANGDFEKGREKPEEVATIMVNHIVLDDEGNAFLCCLGDGLYLYTHTGLVKKLSGKEGLEAAEARKAYLKGNQLFVATERGFYTCSDVRALVAKLSDTELVPSKKGLVLYPNPASDYVYWGFEAQRVAVLSLSGEVLCEAVETNSLYVGDLPQGEYLVVLDRGEKVLPLVVAR